MSYHGQAYSTMETFILSLTSMTYSANSLLTYLMFIEDKHWLLTIAIQLFSTNFFQLTFLQLHVSFLFSGHSMIANVIFVYWLFYHLQSCLHEHVFRCHFNVLFQDNIRDCCRAVRDQPRTTRHLLHDVTPEVGNLAGMKQTIEHSCNIL